MPKTIESKGVSRAHLSVVDLGDKHDRDYWLSRSIDERLEHIEYLRRLNYGDEALGKVKRVLEVVERK
ncbi:MAG: hypothetical protein HQ568_03055 [Calditrichaeota bacterium]|nr:hypothetical protein [Calditrichota bacterium]